MSRRLHFPVLGDEKRSERLTVALEPELKAAFCEIARATPISPLRSDASNLTRILIAAFVEVQGKCGIPRKRRTA